ncbi:hypothetical protein F4604DRAFT_1574591, partial [Suillus subluteus]
WYCIDYYYIVMCPDRKTKWFDRNLDWHDDDRTEVKRIVRQRWTESYATLTSPVPTVTHATSKLRRTASTSKWAAAGSDDEDTFISPDSIEAYLDAPCVSRTEIQAAGGVLQYWENARATRPRLAQMALDFLSAPGM